MSSSSSGDSDSDDRTEDITGVFIPFNPHEPDNLSQFDPTDNGRVNVDWSQLNQPVLQGGSPANRRTTTHRTTQATPTLKTPTSSSKSNSNLYTTPSDTPLILLKDQKPDPTLTQLWKDIPPDSKPRPTKKLLVCTNQELTLPPLSESDQNLLRKKRKRKKYRDDDYDSDFEPRRRPPVKRTPDKKHKFIVVKKQPSHLNIEHAVQDASAKKINPADPETIWSQEELDDLEPSTCEHCKSVYCHNLIFGDYCVANVMKLWEESKKVGIHPSYEAAKQQFKTAYNNYLSIHIWETMNVFEIEKNFEVPYCMVKKSQTTAIAMMHWEGEKKKRADARKRVMQYKNATTYSKQK